MTSQAAPHKILIVDDDELGAAILDHHLPKEHFSLKRALKGEEALLLLEKEDFSLILLDVKMPGMDGFEVLERIRSSARTQHTAVIMLSGMDREEDIIKSFELGANDYVIKPFSPGVLRAKIARHATIACELKASAKE